MSYSLKASAMPGPSNRKTISESAGLMYQSPTQMSPNAKRMAAFFMSIHSLEHKNREST